MGDGVYNRKIKLIRALVGNEKISSIELMNKLQVSQRTLRAEIKEVNDILKRENTCIYSSNMGGYYIKQEEKGTVQVVLDDMIEQSKMVISPETPDERFLFGFVWLFFSKQPVSIQKAAEKLYVSKTSMLQTKKQIQDATRWYHGLYLETENRGMRIQGKEEIIRHALAEIMNYRTYGSILMDRVITFQFGAEKYEHYISLYRILPSILKKHGYRLIDKGIEGFSLDIFLSLMRRSHGFELQEEGVEYNSNACIDAICSYLEEMDYNIPDHERAYLEGCLSAKRILYTLGNNYEIPEEYIAVTEEFLSVTDRTYHTDYRKNHEFFVKLSIHIMKMIDRIQQGYFEINPALNDILDNYGREVEMADKLNPILMNRYHLTANVHEICFIATYFRAYSRRKIKAVVLCDIGESFADNMIRQITDYCGEKIQILDKMSLAEYRINPLPVELIISSFRVYDVNLPENTKIIYVDYLLKEGQLKSIQEFLLKNMQIY